MFLNKKELMKTRETSELSQIADLGRMYGNQPDADSTFETDKNLGWKNTKLDQIADSSEDTDELVKPRDKIVSY